MIYALTAALILALAAAGVLTWQLLRAGRSIRRLQRERQAWQRDRAIRENLEEMIEGRNAEVKRLRSKLRKSEAALEDMEKQASELHLNLFHESGLRILREKEEGARRMKLDLMEKQLDALNRKLKQQKSEAAAEEARLSGIIAEQHARLQRQDEALAEQQAQIEKLTAAQPRRGPRRAHADLPNQLTLNDLLDETGA